MRVAGGTGFARLWGAAGVSNFGDGVYGTALPLLAATLTRDPLLVSLVSFAEWLPWLLFGLLSGALLDRWDRRRVMWTVDAARFAVVGGLAVVVLAGEASIVLLGIVGFLLGTGQTLVDTGSHSILPALVSRDPERLEQANGRLVGTQVVTQELAGPPVGGVLGSLVAARVTRVVGTARVVVWTMVASALAYLVFGLSSDPWLAGVMFGLVGFFTVVFNVILGSLRQALTPDRLLGRVISAFRLFSYGAVPLGSLLGGVLARSFGLRAPFLVAGVVIPLASVLCLPAVNARTIAEARAAAGLEPGP